MPRGRSTIRHRQSRFDPQLSLSLPALTGGFKGLNARLILGQPQPLLFSLALSTTSLLSSSAVDRLFLTSALSFCNPPTKNKDKSPHILFVGLESRVSLDNTASHPTSLEYNSRPNKTHVINDKPATTMSDPLSIPKRKPHQSRPQHINNKSAFNNNPPPTAPSPSTSPYLYYDSRLSPASIDSCLNISPSPASSNSSPYSTPYHISTISAKDKGKGPARGSVSMSRSISGESTMTPWGSVAERRCSLLSEGFARSEHTVVNVGGEEGGLRLVSSIFAHCTFVWTSSLIVFILFMDGQRRVRLLQFPLYTPPLFNRLYLFTIPSIELIWIFYV